MLAWQGPPPPHCTTHLPATTPVHTWPHASTFLAFTLPPPFTSSHLSHHTCFCPPLPTTPATPPACTLHTACLHQTHHPSHGPHIHAYLFCMRYHWRSSALKQATGSMTHAYARGAARMTTRHRKHSAASHRACILPRHGTLWTKGSLALATSGVAGARLVAGMGVAHQAHGAA